MTNYRYLWLFLAGATLVTSNLGCELIAKIDTSALYDAGLAGQGGNRSQSSATRSLTASAGGAGGATGTSGAGGQSLSSTSSAQPCVSDQDCTAPKDVCQVAKCDPVTHGCVVSQVADGGTAAARVQEPGTCSRVVCNEFGVPTPIPDLTNLPNDGEQCTVDTCTTGADDAGTSVGVPVFAPAPSGTCDENGGFVCATPDVDGGGGGHCVVCNTNDDCAAEQFAGAFCQLHVCVTSQCNNGKQDGTETDVDCGGLCAPCGDYRKCLIAHDCQTGVCNAGVCAPATCTDNVKNESESDVDCGGPICRPLGKLCDTGQHCASGADCISTHCDSTNKCVVASCTDGFKNEGETDLDCGGPVCDPQNYLCKTTQRCLQDVDCIPEDGCSTRPDAGPYTCVDHCVDGHQNKLETDTDCGGTGYDGGAPCPRCATNLSCLLDSDCVSGDGCATGGAKLSTCQGHCVDKHLDQGETDIDCGGTCGPTCKDGQMCGSDGDCTSGDGCDPVAVPNVCHPYCADEKKDQGETDIDCGGTTACKRCPTNKGCGVDSDCVTGDGCDTVTAPNVCQLYCFDEKKDQGETDTDCGGSTACKRCADGQGCALDSDCIAGDGCDPKSLKCAIYCSDEKKDQGETDIDCGGSTSCDRCPTGKGCGADSDCVTGDGCDPKSSLCELWCHDEKKDQGESGIDCGGTSSCGPCATGFGCGQDTDCVAGDACDAKSSLCEPWCQDHKQDHNESGIDCGGTSGCGLCGTGFGCGQDSDCIAADACDANSSLCEPWCQDHKKDHSESGVDCGGTSACGRCATGFGCTLDTDCIAADACDALANTCQPWCHDNKKDHNESGVDCGGTSGCGACGTGFGCTLDTDCIVADACDALVNTCQAWCQDHKKDHNESGIDCGGSSTCGPCGTGLGCTQDTDCVAGDGCDPKTLKCAPFCTDQKADNNETGVDCGLVSGCGLCATGLGCSADTDCVAGDGCDTTTVPNVCQLFCHDEKVDNGESDVDCGLACGASQLCGYSKNCLGDSDCESGQCNADNTCGCVHDSDCTAAGEACNGKTNLCTTYCTDGKKDHAETDTDCGNGSSTGCPTCGYGATCSTATDCTSNFCVSGHCGCSQDSECTTAGQACDPVKHLCEVWCQDQKQDHNETGVDCGGTSGCGLCSTGQGCAGAGDCASGFCISNQCGCTVDGDCTTPGQACDTVKHVCEVWCQDEKHDHNESGVDCGGTSSCPRCPTGQACGGGGDCASGYCISNQCGCTQDTDCPIAGDGCDTLKHVCALACQDEKQDDNETGVDCGGPCGATCDYGVGCNGAGDCVSGICNADLHCGCTTYAECHSLVSGNGCDTKTTHTCKPHCSDGVKDAAETDVDCGGSCGNTCACGQACLVLTDCAAAGATCVGSVCVCPDGGAPDGGSAQDAGADGGVDAGDAG